MGNKKKSIMWECPNCGEEKNELYVWADDYMDSYFVQCHACGDSGHIIIGDK